jgi:hypothetical protein
LHAARVAVHDLRENCLKEVVAEHAAREVEFRQIVAAREVKFHEAVAVHATREVELEEAVGVHRNFVSKFQKITSLQAQHFGAHTAHHEIELCRLCDVRAQTAYMTNLITVNNTYTEREISLRTQVMILSKKIESDRKIYTSQRCVMEKLHFQQLDLIAKTHYDIQQTHNRSCRQEFEVWFWEAVQTRTQEFKMVLEQRCTEFRRLLEIEHTGRMSAECLLESERNKICKFVSLRTARLNKVKIPCID